MEKSLINYAFLTQPVEVYKRENGHTIVLAHKEGDLANVSTWVKTGSINENDKNNGISHFLEHLMFKGTEKHPAGYFDRTLEAKGAIVNAATWKDYTFYYVTLPKGKDCCDLNLAIELHADMMLNPILPYEEIGAPFDLDDKNVTDKRERHVVIEEIRMRQDQSWTKVYNNCNYNMYTKHPYKRDVIGTPEIISKVTREDIMDYYKTFYSPENMTTIVVGEFNHDEILSKLEKEFDFKDRANALQKVFEPDKPVGETKFIVDTSLINTSYAMYGWLCPRASELKTSICLDLISLIFGDGTSSRLYQNLIEKLPEQIFNVIGSEHYQFRDGNNFFIQANFKPDKKDEALKLINEQLEQLLSVEITEDELQKAKKKTKAKFAYSAETVSEIGENIGYFATVCNDLKLVEEYLKVLENITISDLNDTIQKYLNINNATISLLLPKELNE